MAKIKAELKSSIWGWPFRSLTVFAEHRGDGKRTLWLQLTSRLTYPLSHRADGHPDTIWAYFNYHLGKRKKENPKKKENIKGQLQTSLPRPLTPATPLWPLTQRPLWTSGSTFWPPVKWEREEWQQNAANVVRNINSTFWPAFKELNELESRDLRKSYRENNTFIYYFKQER